MADSEEADLVSEVPLPFVLAEEAHGRGEGVAVDSGFDREDLEVSADHVVHAVEGVVQRRVGGVVERAGVSKSVGVVVVTQAAVAGQSYGD
ncbi:hypothetical protein [Streptomyces mirabilis]